MSMTHAIYKYPLQVTDSQLVEMPIQAQILCVQVQRNMVCLWAKVRLTAPTETRQINIVGTGHQFGPAIGDYVGTVQLEGGALVFHVFDAGETARLI